MTSFFRGGVTLCDEVTRGGGSKIGQYSVTSFMDGPQSKKLMCTGGGHSKSKYNECNKDLHLVIDGFSQKNKRVHS